MLEQLSLDGPYLNVAVICEKVLVEKDGVQTLVRIIDHLHIRGNSPEMLPTQLTFTIAVSFRSGLLRGVQKITIAPTSPSGAALPEMGVPVSFEGDDDRGVFVGMETRFVFPEPGLYWMEVKLAGTLVTKIPLRISYYHTGK